MQVHPSSEIREILFLTVFLEGRSGSGVYAIAPGLLFKELITCLTWLFGTVENGMFNSATPAETPTILEVFGHPGPGAAL